MHDLRNETGRTAWHMPNDFTETVINAANKQGICVTIIPFHAPYMRQGKDGEAAEEVCGYTVK
jgi:hypothetical protein